FHQLHTPGPVVPVFDKTNHRDGELVSIDALVVIDDLDRIEHSGSVTVLDRYRQGAVALQGRPVLRPAFAPKMDVKVVDRETGKGLEVVVIEFQGGRVAMQHAPVMAYPDQQILHVIQGVL